MSANFFLRNQLLAQQVTNHLHLLVLFYFTLCLHLRVIKVAKQFVSEGLTFAVSDRGSFTYELQALGLDTSVKDVIVGLYDAKGAKYAMEPDFSVDNLREFVQEYLDGGLEPYIKSEPVPEDNSGPVKVVCVCVCARTCVCVCVCVCVCACV